MAYDYSSIKNTAISLINKFGRNITKKAITNTGTEWNPTQTAVESTIKGVFTNFSQNEIDGTLIKATDKKVLTYDEIELTDLIVDDSISYNVISVFSINPGDTKLIYKVQLRQ